MPKILDLFCGAGGASMGYSWAGFDVMGVDIIPQPNYPFPFYQEDALTFPFKGFDAIHASPPCQRFTKYRNARPQLVSSYPDFITPIRQRLAASGKPWVIENVPGSPLKSPMRLCGSMFGLDVQRHRLFESNFFLVPFGSCDHTIWPITPRFPGGRSRERGGPRVLVRKTCEIGRWNIPLHVQQQAMGINWMNLEELSEALPPCYTQWIGTQMRPFVRA